MVTIIITIPALQKKTTPTTVQPPSTVTINRLINRRTKQPRTEILDITTAKVKVRSTSSLLRVVTVAKITAAKSLSSSKVKNKEVSRYTLRSAKRDEGKRDSRHSDQ